jgi:putative addiction module antidote
MLKSGVIFIIMFICIKRERWNVTTLKLTAIGTSTGVIIPKSMLDRMNVSKGDALYATEAPDGSYRLTPYDPTFVQKMEKADDIMRRYRNTLQALAK